MWPIFEQGPRAFATASLLQLYLAAIPPLHPYRKSAALCTSYSTVTAHHIQCRPTLYICSIILSSLSVVRKRRNCTTTTHKVWRKILFSRWLSERLCGVECTRRMYLFFTARRKASFVDKAIFADGDGDRHRRQWHDVSVVSWQCWEYAWCLYCNIALTETAAVLCTWPIGCVSDVSIGSGFITVCTRTLHTCRSIELAQQNSLQTTSVSESHS